MKDILLHVADDRRVQERAKVAIDLARKFDAHITALFTIPQAQIPAYVMGYVPVDVTQRIEKEAEERGRKAQAVFEDSCRQAGVRAEWRMARGLPGNAVTLHGRYADMTVLAQPDDSDGDLPAEILELPHDVVMEVGGPVLCVPYAGRFDSLGKNIMIGWNGTREAVRAVRDAMPFLRAAETVLVFSVNSEDGHRQPGADLATHLARHGVRAEAAHTVARDIEVGDAILAALSDNSCDMLVIGAYGHSRMREWAFGGVTRKIFHEMTVPVLLSH
ncbi:MAG: universal stress protein [Sneathiellaceae bacterium]